MNQNYIQFKKQRELGDILNDTFKFIRLHFKPLMKMVLKMVWPLLLLLTLTSGYYLTVSLKSEESLFSLSLGDNVVEILLSYTFMYFAAVAYSAMLYSCVLHYIKSYITNNGEVMEKEVVQATKSDFGPMFGLMLIVSIMLIIGFGLFLIPGIYLSVPLALTFSLMIFDRKSISDSISDCFGLVKDNWWITFFTFVVVMIVVYIISMVFSIPAVIYMVIKTITVSQEGSAANVSAMFDWVYIALNLFSSVAQYILYIIPAIATVFVFYNLKEQKYLTGTYETINSLGKEKE